MEPEGSLPHSQVPATCAYPEPARSNPYPTSWRSILMLSSHLRLGPCGLAYVSKLLEQGPLEKRLFPQVVRKFPALCGTGFITAFTAAPPHLLLSWARLHQSKISTPISVRSTHFNIILPPMPSSSNWSLSLTFSRQTMHALLFSHFVTHGPLSQHTFEAHRYVLSSITPFLYLRLQYLPHHSLHMFFPLWETKFHTHVKRRIVPQVLYILSFSFLYSLIARMTAACHIARTADTQDRNCHGVKPEGYKTPKHILLEFTVVTESPRLASNCL